jgi:hypothetical protein
MLLPGTCSNLQPAAKRCFFKKENTLSAPRLSGGNGLTMPLVLLRMVALRFNLTSLRIEKLPQLLNTTLLKLSALNIPKNSLFKRMNTEAKMLQDIGLYVRKKELDI